MKNIRIITLAILLIQLNTGCMKEFLDAKPSTSIVQPTTLEEFERLLDNIDAINNGAALGILGTDEYEYSSDATWLSARTATTRNSYIWAKDLYEGEQSLHWNQPYTVIFYANNVLAGLDKIQRSATNNSEWNRIKGWALFVRAFAYYELVNNFAVTYDATTAETDLGVPLRLKPSIDELLPRASVEETYERIFIDLNEATGLLDANMPMARSRPSKAAAHALFARIYLNRRDYTKAELHADMCLALYDKLLDYNSLSKTSTNPFKYNHDEQIYAKLAVSEDSYISTGSNSFIQISTELIDLYTPNDLRLLIFFSKQNDGTYDTKRGYFASYAHPFIGLATDEVYLIKAECAARNDNVLIAMNTLNELLSNRYVSGTFVPTTATSKEDALSKVLLERRKELVWRNSRWDDLKRLNKEGANITLTRTINGQTYTLPPNSPKYIFPIPDNEINFSGIQQNIR